ncbi:hypothetical protein M3Y97_00200600 [Aphelenchoides bicaudatus]|nr:hypothetical protein M3Y97_00200600 [Aphelenchoides bicaudatus]
MNQQPMYGSTACSVNIPSTSSLPHQQPAGGVPNAPLYYVPQISTDPYGPQIIQYGDTYGQEAIYPSKEMFAPPTNTFARLPNAYSYNNTIPSGQNDFASNIAPQFQPPPLGAQNNSTAQITQIIPQQQSQFQAGQQRSVVNMMQPALKTTYQKRGPEQTYQIGYSNNTFGSPTAPYPPQLNQIQQQKVQTNVQNGNSVNNGQDQRNSRLATMFDNPMDNYNATASWVSSTSSIPPDQKIPPDQGSRHNSPNSFEFSNWSAELPKMNEASTQNAGMATASNQQIPGLQQQMQPIHAYAGQQFHVPTTTPSAIPQMAYYASNQQPQFAVPPAVGYYPPYIPPQYVLPNALPMAIPNYTTMPVNFGQQQFVSPALALYNSPLNPLFAPETRMDKPQDSRFNDTWLDGHKPTQQELNITKEVVPFALDHNSRQFSRTGSRNGLLFSLMGQQPIGNNDSRDGYKDSNRGSGPPRKFYNNKQGGRNNYYRSNGNESNGGNTQKPL